MKRPNVSGLKEAAADRLQQLTSARLLRDKLSLSILLPALAVNIANLALLALKVHPSELAVPVRYSSLEGFSDLGKWYQIYYIGLFGLVVTLGNTVLAMMSFSRSRITSFFLLIGAFVVSLFCLVISAAFAAII
jgi:hypothetical protein